MAVETWRAIPGYDGHYEVSDLGRVRSLDRVTFDRNGRPYRRTGLELKPGLSNKGYRTVELCIDGVGITHRIHALVALAFIGPRPTGLVVCHNDGDKHNNTPANLRYDTASENALDLVRHGGNRLASLTHCKRGHAFTDANTKRVGRTRNCRTCIAANERARKARTRVEATP